MRICCMAQETQTGALYQPRGMGWGGRWEGGSKGRVYVYLGLWRKPSAEELMLLNCGVGEDSWEPPWTTRRSNQSILRNQSWIFIGRTDAKAETPILWPLDMKSWLIGKDWCWEGLGAGGEGDDRGWDGWMASLTRWTWVWINSKSWWWTGWPGMLQFMGLQRVGHNWATELNWCWCWIEDGRNKQPMSLAILCCKAIPPFTAAMVGTSELCIFVNSKKIFILK